ncbi:MAG: hypothetical protein WBB08_08805 [Halobacteriota archaeon]
MLYTIDAHKRYEIVRKMDKIANVPGNMKTLNQSGYEIIYEDLVAEIIFSKASQMLTKLTIPFSIDDIKEESDAEDDSWRYTVVKIKMNVKEDFNRISDKIISYAYSDIDPNDATRVLLVLENV